MVSIENLTQTSNRKLTTLFNSPVSSSLRMEVLITNLLVSIERGEFKGHFQDSDDEENTIHQMDMDEDGDEEEALEQEQDNDGLWQTARTLKRRSSRVSSYEGFADDDPIFAEDEDELDNDSDDVPSPIFDHFDGDDSDDLVPSSTSPNKVHSRRNADFSKRLKKVHGGNLQLEDIEIEVMDDQWLSSSPAKENLLANYLSSEEPSAPSPQKSPLVIRIKVPTSSVSSDSDLPSPQKKRRREVGHDEQSMSEDLDEDGEPREDVRYSLKGTLLASPKKKLKSLCEEREPSRAQ